MFQFLIKEKRVIGYAISESCARTYAAINVGVSYADSPAELGDYDYLPKGRQRTQALLRAFDDNSGVALI